MQAGFLILASRGSTLRALTFDQLIWGFLTMNAIRREPEFSALSVSDLLEAREAYHVHLMNLEHVVATAIGKYLIRKTDPDAKDGTRMKKSPSGAVRTLTNTVIQPWSWPCVLVFVDEWATPADFAKKPEDFVPPRLYLPDGRIVPTCVVYAEKSQLPSQPIDDLHFSDGLLGGGYPVLSNVQGEQRVGTLACMVTDGHSIFALTNRHVAGPPDQPSYTVADAEQKRIGNSDALSVGKIPFTEAYPGWASERTQLNLDAGLIRLDDINIWTSQVFGVGPLGTLADANVDTLTLDIIDAPVRAFGGVSGAMAGSVFALFYRYQTVGGFDYVADFLIGPRQTGEEVPTRPGDSGTLWFIDHEAIERKNAASQDDAVKPAKPTKKFFSPLAMQWGGDALEGPGAQSRFNFALGSSLGTICRVLDVNIVPHWGLGHSEYWGKVGHYKIGAEACKHVANAKLSTLLLANVDRIAVSDTDIENNRLPMASNTQFVALADVPDLVWRSKRGKDKANHFADMDELGKGPFLGRTLMDMWKADPTTRTPATWTAFYDALNVGSDAHRGALPFRARQLYEEMVDAVKNESMLRYIGAAGVLAHYIGDACQPLHVSRLHHGRPGHPGEAEVHSVYETNMLDRFRVEVIAGINQKLNGLAITTSYAGGDAAADASVQLMDYTTEVLPPIDVIKAYNDGAGQDRTKFMWGVLKDRTIECMSEGAMYLAEMWESAWLEGGGNQIASTKLVAQDRTKLKNLYLKREWVESDWLKNM